MSRFPCAPLVVLPAMALAQDDPKAGRPAEFKAGKTASLVVLERAKK